MRLLKFHEKKLLKHQDFINWEIDNNLHQVKILRRFRIQNREDYTAYNKMARQIREIANKIRDLDPDHPYKKEATAALLKKLYDMGLTPTMRTLECADRISATSFCRRRLASLVFASHMAENMKAAVTFVEHGHIRVGPRLVTDPAYIVPRSMEDFITWADTSKIRKHVLQYNEELDDAEFL